MVLGTDENGLDARNMLIREQMVNASTGYLS